ncbi:hypothetical protein S7335_1040 [Synechococcus sp. PCC 7335]|nr:hypothetical protein S7335_1040 [Synechococcus sp. PCC 7335]
MNKALASCGYEMCFYRSLVIAREFVFLGIAACSGAATT